MIRGFMKHRGQLVCEARAVMLLSVALDGCIAERYDTPGGVDGKLIKFTPAVVASKGTSGTRAVGGHPIESGSNIPVDGSFGTYAYSKITPISSIVSYDALQNMKVTSDGTDFTYSPVAKWPVEREAELAFYGYYPWQSQSAPPAPGDPVIGIMMGAQTPSMTIAYVTPTNPSKQVDLMYAYTGMTTGSTLVELFGLCRELNAQAEGVEVGPAPVAEETNPEMAVPIEDLNLTQRSYNCLKREGIHTIGELVSHTEQDLLDIRNFGMKSIDEVKEKLQTLGLSLKSSPMAFDTNNLEGGTFFSPEDE